MTRLTVGADLVSKLSAISGLAEICDPLGRHLGYFLAAGSLKHFSPISDDELQRRRLQRGGRTLAEIIRDLENRT